MSFTYAGMTRRWDQTSGFFPENLTEIALRTGAVERFRKIRNGEDLLLASLLCALPGDTFESAALTLKESSGISLSAPAMFLRFEKCEGFLQEVFVHVLKHSQCHGAYLGGRRVAIVDATMLAGPGADRADQRVHVVYNPSSGLPERVEITTDKQGETLLRHEFVPGTLVLADRGYGHPAGILSVLQAGSSVLVRFEFESMRLLDSQDLKITPDKAKSLMDGKERHEFPAKLEGWERELRVIGSRTPEDKIVWLLTDLPQESLSLNEARGIYSARWQVELFFKRLKSLLDLDEIPTRDGPSARPWMWAKLILAALATLSSDERFSPWGSPA